MRGSRVELVVAGAKRARLEGGEAKTFLQRGYDGC